MLAWQGGGSDNGLFGSPVVTADTFFFIANHNFEAQSFGGAPVTTSDTLRVRVHALNGNAFSEVVFQSSGDYTLFGPGVQILTPVHPMNAELRRREEYGKPIEIGADVWVGGAALILPGVRIGSRTVIGAGSVVTRDVPDGVFAAGNPCRVIREITE